MTEMVKSDYIYWHRSRQSLNYTTKNMLPLDRKKPGRKNKDEPNKNRKKELKIYKYNHPSSAEKLYT